MKRPLLLPSKKFKDHPVDDHHFHLKLSPSFERLGIKLVNNFEKTGILLLPFAHQRFSTIRPNPKEPLYWEMPVRWRHLSCRLEETKKKKEGGAIDCLVIRPGGGKREEPSFDIRPGLSHKRKQLTIELLAPTDGVTSGPYRFQPKQKEF